MSQLFVNEISSYTGSTVIINGVTINNGAISATTYENFPTDVYVTGGTYSNGSAVFTNNTGGTFSVTGFSASGGGDSFIEVTYSELVSAITGSTLSAGTYYMITDFRTCYDQPDYDYNKNAITSGIYRDDTEIQPILVFATSSNTISDVAYQPAYPNDRIRYDWTFSTTERTNNIAYGRISERIDGFNNRTDYDHRQIKFKRYRYYEYQLDNPYNGTIQVSVVSGLTMSVSGTGTNFNSIGVGNLVGFDDSDYKIFEITNIVSDTEMTVTGLTTTSVSSGRQMYPTDWDEYSSYYQNNVQGGSQFEEYYTFDFNDTNINNYIGDFSNLRNWEEWDFLLANNVFHNRFNNNKFGDACFNNTFFDDCWNNNVGNYFYNNITDDDFDGNVIGSFFRDNRITANFQYNRIGENFQNNYIVQNSFYRNNIMNDFRDNEISGGDFQNNEIGNQFNNNIFRNGQFYKNDIGNGYNGNKIYYNFYGNLIGNAFNYNNIYCEFSNNTIGEYFGNNNLGDVNDVYSYVFNENVVGVNFLNNTIFSDFYKNHIGVSFEQNSISGLTTNNFIGNQFSNNTIYNNFLHNKISNEFKGNMMLQSFEENSTDSFIGGNQFSGSTYRNNIGSYTFSNDFLGSLNENTWKSDFYSNTIGFDFYNNSIGNSFYNNTIGNGFQYNQIGDNFNNNDIDDNFGFGFITTQGNRIGNNFFYNTIGEYFYNNSISDNFRDNEVGDYFQWNVINTDITETYFTLNYGNLTGFSYTATGTSATDNLYLGVQICGATESMGVDATFDIEVSGGSVIGVSGNSEGRLYHINDELTILGTQIGGVTPNDNITITVTGVTSGSLFYDHYTKQIFERKGGNKRVSFYDEEDILTVDSVYEASGYIPVYSQPLTFPINNTSFEFQCNGSYSNNGGFTGNQTNSIQDVVNLFNANFRSTGYFFDNNDGTIGVYINPSLKKQYCSSGTYTINVFND